MKSHAAVQPLLLIEDSEGQVGQKLANQHCSFPLRNILSPGPGSSAVD